MYVHTDKMVSCPSCGSGDIVSISMTVEELGVEFRACHRCEYRWWEQDGHTVPLNSVVSRIPKR